MARCRSSRREPAQSRNRARTRRTLVFHSFRCGFGWPSAAAVPSPLTNFERCVWARSPSSLTNASTGFDRRPRVADASPRTSTGRPPANGTYASAPFLTTKGFMQELRVGSPRGASEGRGGSGRRWGAWRSIKVEHHLNKRGITVDQSGTGHGGRIAHTSPPVADRTCRHEIIVQLDFELPAPVLRGGPFVCNKRLSSLQFFDAGSVWIWRRVLAGEYAP